MSTKIKSLFISDVHLNSNFCQTRPFLKLLKEYDCENLFLLGDILDFYVKGFNLPTNQINVIRKILTKAKRGVNVNYILGNHDSIISNYLEYDFNIENIKITEELVYESNGNKILLTHGHFADSPIISKLYVLGDTCYTILLYINSIYNCIREKLGLSYFSLSQKVKDNVKDAVKYISDYENTVINYTKLKHCNIVICGHIHKAEIKVLDNISYLNCGDFVESCTAIIETLDGKFQLVQYKNEKFNVIKQLNFSEVSFKE